MERFEGIEWFEDDKKLVQVQTIPWVASGTYIDCWRAMRNYVLKCKESKEGLDDAVIVGRALSLMQKAHVVTCSKEQCEVLPSTMDQLAQYGKHLTIPFDPVFLSLDNAKIGTGGYATGALIEYQKGAGIAVYSTIRDPFGNVRFAGFTPTWVGLEELSRLLGDEQEKPLNKAAIEMAERVLAVLALIDGTSGVELEPAKVSRQVRRAAERKGKYIALEVVIRPSCSSEDKGGKVEYSHRFERRAYIACITKGPKFKPEKLASWCPRHGVRKCRREYRSSTIIGSTDRPFVPKLRKIGKM